MIKTPTVFVLGAGASIPYGFPSGAELRVELCGIERYQGYEEIMLENFSPAHIREFANNFLRSSVNSIDSFLARRPEYVEVGKLAIAMQLCVRENPSKFENPMLEDNWYSAIWNALIEDVNSLDKLKGNNVKVITFNYDRSLEYFLFSAIKHTFGASDGEAYSALKSIPILHFYGSLGDFGVGGRPYQVTNDQVALSVAAKGIKIIPEARDDEPNFQTAQDWLFSTCRICILGFSFDRLNVNRLGLQKVITESKDIPSAPFRRKTVVASTFKMTEAEVVKAKTLMGGEELEWFTNSQMSLITLRNHAWILE